MEANNPSPSKVLQKTLETDVSMLFPGCGSISPHSLGEADTIPAWVT
jgi:hypothetical protein